MEVSPVGDHLMKVTLKGRLDGPGVGRVETRFLASLVPGAHNAIVDVSGVDFITSLGIRMFVSAARSLRMRNARLAVFGAQEQVSQVFAIGALSQMIAICATEDEALATVAS